MRTCPTSSVADYDNLLLLRDTHHITIDRDVETWTAAKLKDLKRKHEAIYTADSRLGCRSA